MANIIFVLLFVVGIAYSMISNRKDIVLNVILSAPKDAFLLFIDIYVLLIFWGGILEIMKRSGLLKTLSQIIIFFIHPLFKRIDRNDEALEYIAMNYLANMLSMGACATPFGLKAMDRLKELNNNLDVASNEMITFLLVNTSGLCLIPTTLLAIRNQYGSMNSAKIVPFVLLISTISTILSIIIGKVCEHFGTN